MKLMWLLAVALCGLLAMAPSADAESALDGNIEIKEDHALESKLLKEVDSKDDAMAEVEDEQDNQAKVKSDMEMEITEKDIAALNDPGMQRLARYLRSYHNRNLQRSNNNHIQEFSDEDDDEPPPQERAVRRRIRIRRRNTKNKIKNVSTEDVKRRKSSRRKPSRKSTINRQKNQKFRSRKSKRNRRNRYGSMKGKRRRHGVRSGHRRRNSNRRRRVKGTRKPQPEAVEEPVAADTDKEKEPSANP